MFCLHDTIACEADSGKGRRWDECFKRADHSNAIASFVNQKSCMDIGLGAQNVRSEGVMGAGLLRQATTRLGIFNALGVELKGINDGQVSLLHQHVECVRHPALVSFLH